MNKLRLIAAVVIAGAFAVLSTGPAQAYPDSNGITLTATSPLIGGHVTHFTATAQSECSTLTVTFSDGKAASETAVRSANNVSTLSGSYVTKHVSHTTTTHMSASCVYDDNCPSGYSGPGDTGGNCPVLAPAKAHSNSVTSAFYSLGSSSAVIQAATHTASTTANVVLLPRHHNGDGDDNGGLPNTGGSNLWILVLGGVLLVGGGATILVARRRSTH
jgi:LPXTG-motif cell wall-anchored protein